MKDSSHVVLGDNCSPLYPQVIIRRWDGRFEQGNSKVIYHAEALRRSIYQLEKLLRFEDEAWPSGGWERQMVFLMGDNMPLICAISDAFRPVQRNL